MSYVKLHDLLTIEIKWRGPTVVHHQEKMEVFSMASIQKRKKANGEYSYRVRIRVEGAPLVTDTYSTRKEALAFARRMEAEIRAGRYFGKEEDKEKSFAEFIDRYIEKELPKNPKGYAKQKMLLTWWKSKLGSYFLCHITPAMIAELRDDLMKEMTYRKKLRTSSTTNRYLASLSRAFNICQKEWNWIKENPVRKISRPKENKARERYLEKEEIALLLEACRKSKSPHLYPITLFALATGARKGEIMNLTWQDIDFSRSTAIFRNTKNGTDRTVHLSPSILNCLQEEQGKRIILSEYVFPSADGKSPGIIRTAWDNVIKELGWENENVCFHSLRHTTASHLAQNGVSSLEIAAILGHKTLTMVKRYSHFSTASTAPILNKIDNELLGKVIND